MKTNYLSLSLNTSLATWNSSHKLITKVNNDFDPEEYERKNPKC